jgi:2-hydroxy-3-keto-5-methylthiopentenyl-1-phosphate phosphatase
MNSIHKPEVVFIDFDGVISKNSVLSNIKSAHTFINQYISIPYEALFTFFKSTTSFSMQHTFGFLLTSLGIDMSESNQEQLMLSLYENIKTIIEADFYDFLDFCDRNSIRYLIYSSADKGIKRIPELIDRIGINGIYNLNGRSKANRNTYLEAAKELKIDLKNSMYIDDTPLALQTGKLHGMTTVMMLNSVFTLEDYQIFSSYIDYKINSFTELLEIFKN